MCASVLLVVLLFLLQEIPIRLHVMIDVLTACHFESAHLQSIEVYC